MGFAVALGLLVVLIILVAYYVQSKAERLYVGQPAIGVLTRSSVTDAGKWPDQQPYVRLYEGPQQTQLAFEFAPILDYELKIGNGYMRIFLPINLQSLDISLPAVSADYDPMRHVRIWQVFGNDENASTESGFYNDYTAPDFVFKANGAKYQLIADITAGQHVVSDVSNVVKRVFLDIVL